MLIVRELTGGLYFGEKIESNFSSDICVYTVDEIKRVTDVAIDYAKKEEIK